MLMADLGDIRLHYRDDGPRDGAPLVLAHALGTDLRLWDDLMAHLPPGLRVVRADMRGHGLSDAPPGPYGMGMLVRDLERLVEHLALRPAVLVGLSIGGMIAQGLAIKRPDLLRGVVLSNTAARIGTAEQWAQRIAAVQAGGLAAVSEATLARWFAPAMRDSAQAWRWRHMLERTPLHGYAGCASAIAGTDFWTPLAGVRTPVLGIAGDADGSTPPDLVRETLGQVPDGRFVLIRGAGHLACVDRPAAYAEHLARFLSEIGHLSSDVR